jgi:hypothetical protein
VQDVLCAVATQRECGVFRRTVHISIAILVRTIKYIVATVDRIVFTIKYSHISRATPFGRWSAERKTMVGHRRGSGCGRFLPFAPLKASRGRAGNLYKLAAGE